MSLPLGLRRRGRAVTSTRRAGAGAVLLLALSAALSGCSLLPPRPNDASPSGAVVNETPPGSTEAAQTESSPPDDLATEDPAITGNMAPPPVYVPRWPQFEARTRKGLRVTNVDLSAATLVYGVDDDSASGPRRLPRLPGPGTLVVSGECRGEKPIEVTVTDAGRVVHWIMGCAGAGLKDFPAGIAKGLVTVDPHGAKRYVAAVFWLPTR